MENHWLKFRDENRLIGRDAEIPETESETHGKYSMRFFSDSLSFKQMNEVYPGIAAAPLGYFPIGCCLFGSGDPFFVRLSEESDYNLYQIYHDSYDSEGVPIGIDVVLTDYRSVLDFLDEE